MGIKPKPVVPTPAQVASDNAAAQQALAARAQKLDDTAAAIKQRLADDPGLSAYPKAQTQLREAGALTEKQRAIVAKEQEVRGRLGEAAAAGDKEGIASGRAELAQLKKDNSKIYGKGSVANPTAACPNDVSTEKCDTSISSVKYGESRGPSSPISSSNPCYGTTLAEWDGWDDMIAHGCATAEEKSIIQAMSANEGSFEAVQAYDSAQLTVGAMQKTMNDTGGGELTQQIADFKSQDPTGYKRLFADKGWTVVKDKLTHTDSAGTARTGKALGDYLRSADQADVTKALSPMRSAGRDPAFRKQQICDFIGRLHSSSDRSVKIGKQSYPMGDVLTSTKGKAMMLDTSVNAGPYEKAFQRSVTSYFTAHPKAGADPGAWTEAERATHESGILATYEATRPVTDRALRNRHLAGLSADPNAGGRASQRPARDCPDCPE